MNLFKTSVAVSLGLVFFSVSAAQAASQITRAWSTYTGNGFLNWEDQSVTAYDKERSRNESQVHRLFSTRPDVFVQIERTDLDKRWQVDPRKKRYTEESISEAAERQRREMEKAEAEYAKQEKKQPNAEKAEETVRIKSAKTTTQGPGAAVDVNGFSAKPYTIRTEIVYEDVKTHETATQNLYTKVWTTQSKALAQYHQDESAYWQARAKDQMTSLQKSQFLKQMQVAVLKAQTNPAENPWFAHVGSASKISGEAVRSVFVFTVNDPSGQKAEKTPKDESSENDSLVQPGDISGGVGGLVSGIATRWASKKVNEKVQAKMAQHPAWVDEISKELGSDAVGWGFMEEVKSVSNEVPAEMFEIPAGYKKVKSL